MSYKSYEQMELEKGERVAEYKNWAKNDFNNRDKKSMMMKDTITHPNGKTTTIYQGFNSKKGNDRIDGHFWIEDLNGKLLSDCGFTKYQHKLPCFNDKNYYNPSNDFVVYQHCPNPILEQKIIKNQVERLIKAWGKDTIFHDPRSQVDRFKAVARNMWENRDKMLSGGFECLQTAVCEWVVRGEDKCRIRFGSAGIVRPRVDEVFWFFGHPDNTEYGEWIVKDAVSADGKDKKDVKHDRCMKICEVPNAVKIIKQKKEEEEKVKIAKKIEEEKKRKLAEIEEEKKYQEFIKLDWVNEKKSNNKKQKKNKRK